MVKIWIWLKTIIGRITGKIGKLSLEIECVKKYFPDIPTMQDMEIGKITYKIDPVRGIMDMQTDARYIITVSHQDDCDGLNRVVQVAAHNNGYIAYLVSYLAKPFELSHTTCIVYDSKNYYSMDYGIKEFKSKTIKECVNKIANKYGSICNGYVVQDIQWRIT